MAVTLSVLCHAVGSLAQVVDEDTILAAIRQCTDKSVDVQIAASSVTPATSTLKPRYVFPITLPVVSLHLKQHPVERLWRPRGVVGYLLPERQQYK